MFKSTGLAKMFAGRRKFFRRPHAARGPHVRHLCSRVRNLRKMRNFWANFTDFEPEINIIKCKTENLSTNKKLEYFTVMQDCSLYLGKASLMQKVCKRCPQSSEIFGQKFQ